MHHKFSLKLKYGLLLFIVATSFLSFAQEPDEENDLNLLLDELFFNEQQFVDEILESLKNKQIIYTNINYQSATYSYGRDSGVDQYNIVPQISYFHPSGFNISFSGLYYQNFNPNWDFTSLSLGYYNTIGEKELISYNVGYSKLFYSDGFDTFTNIAELNLGIKNKNRTISSTLSAAYLFGSDQAIQISLSTEGKITLYKDEYFSLKFVPQINFAIAKQTVIFEELNEIAEPDVLEYTSYDVFDLFNSQIKLPLKLVTKSWDFDIGYNINFPNPVAIENKLDNTGFFHMSIGYLIDLQKK